METDMCLGRSREHKGTATQFRFNRDMQFEKQKATRKERYTKLKNYYEVCAKCGHVGKNYYVEKTFAVEAENGKSAAEIVRGKPRVKHDHKDAIRFVKQIDKERFDIIQANIKMDPYFHCKNIQQQNKECVLEKKREENRPEYNTKRKEQWRYPPRVIICI